MKKIISILILSLILLPNFSFAQEQFEMSTPETLEEAKKIGEKALGVGKKELPGIIEKIWKEEVLPIWQRMWDWVKANIWSKIESWIKPEVEKRKQFFEEGFEREKEEMKEEVKTELPKVGKSLWEKFRELIK
ncbi:MAG: hypothetical protein Q8M00_02045 [bacterium]|nr:hypothetical protein [bacterium]